MKTRLSSILASAVLVALLPLGAMAQSSFSVFSPKTGMADGWKTASWSGPIVNEVAGFAKETTTLQVELKGDAQAYAGVVLQAAPGSGLNLTDKLRQTGVVTINFMPGKNAQGEVTTLEQPLQIGLTFLSQDGQTVHAPFNVQATITTAVAGTKVSFTLPNALKGAKNPEFLASISAIRLQYAGAPIAGFYIVDCTIKSE
ncbi:MAG: hypothetical protein ACAH89_04945 [Rariglobus sp.]|nr:hypothetical protein [Rariglobus sp.]